MAHQPITTRSITFFLPDLSPDKTAKVFITLANKFVDDGYKVDILLLYKEGDYLKHIRDGVRVYELGQGRVLKALFAYMKYIKIEQPFIVLSAYSVPNLVSIMAKSLLHMMRAYVPWIAITQTVSLSQRLAELPTFGNKLRNFLSKVFYGSADVVAAGSEDVAKELVTACKLPREKIQIIHSFHDIEKIQKLSQEATEHGWFTKMRPAPVIVAWADLNSQNDYVTLLHALKDIPRVRLFVIGDGPERLMLEDMCDDLYIQDRVEFLGQDKNPYRYIAQADMFVSVSMSEKFPNVLIEALACGTSIVSTDVGSGASEILDKGKYGRLVSVRNAESYIDAIEGEMVAPVSTRTEKIDRANVFGFQNVASKFYDMLLNVED